MVGVILLLRSISNEPVTSTSPSVGEYLKVVCVPPLGPVYSSAEDNTPRGEPPYPPNDKAFIWSPAPPWSCLLVGLLIPVVQERPL